MRVAQKANECTRFEFEKLRINIWHSQKSTFSNFTVPRTDQTSLSPLKTAGKS